MLEHRTKTTQFLNFTSRSWEADIVFQSHVQPERKIAHSAYLMPKELVKALLCTFSLTYGKHWLHMNIKIGHSTT